MAETDDLVGFIVAEHSAGYWLYACDEHTPPELREDERQVLREEAAEEHAECVACGYELTDL